MPVRVDLVGQRVRDNGTDVTVYDFHHYYDYVSFMADDLMLAEELEFQIPDFYEECNVTAYCNVYADADICSITKGPPVPRVPNNFMSRCEWTVDEAIGYGKASTEIDTYYDYDNDRAHKIHRYDDQTMHQLDLLTDEYGDGQVWIWFGDGIGSTMETSDDEIKNCSVQAAGADGDGYDYFFPAANGHVFNPHRFLLFDDNVYDPGISDEVWMGYTEVRGIPAEKWKATFNIVVHGHEASPYSFISAQLLADNQRKVAEGTVIWYFSSQSDWKFPTTAGSSIRPLGVDIHGAYTIYNISDAFELIVHSNGTFKQYGAFTRWIEGTPDDAWFEPPLEYEEECDIASYCGSYPEQSVCSQMEMEKDDSKNDENVPSNNGLGAGYIILMIALLFFGMVIGFCVDRYYIKRLEIRASFNHGANKNIGAEATPTKKNMDVEANVVQNEEENEQKGKPMETEIEINEMEDTQAK